MLRQYFAENWLLLLSLFGSVFFWATLAGWMMRRCTHWWRYAKALERDNKRMFELCAKQHARIEDLIVCNWHNSQMILGMERAVVLVKRVRNEVYPGSLGKPLWTEITDYVNHGVYPAIPGESFVEIDR